MGCTCGRGLRERGGAVRAAALPGDMAPAADVRCRRQADIEDCDDVLLLAGRGADRGSSRRRRSQTLANLRSPILETMTFRSGEAVVVAER